MQTVVELLEHIPSENLPYPPSSLIDELEGLLARHIRKMREAIPLYELPPWGQLSGDSFRVAYDAVIQMTMELFARILQGLRSHNAGTYEKWASLAAKRMREFALQVWSTYLGNNDSERDFDCFCQELDAILHGLLQQAITAAWIGHEAHYSDSAAREKARWESTAVPTAAFGAADVEPDTTGQLGPTGEVNGDAADGRDLGVAPHFPRRAAWLEERLRERSWSRHDLSRNGGLDWKTVQKILDGQRIREDGLEKVAIGLSKASAWMKLTPVTLLDIPQD